MAAHGRYTIVGKLADGGMAEIFLGTQHGVERFEKQVVLKRIHTALGADAQFRNMFIDEAHISMSLSHGNIVQVLDLGVANGRYFLVLELVDGWDLDRVLKRARAAAIAWPPALSLYVAAEVCRALSFAHAKSQNGRPLGIVHRDVSPNNVLLSEQGEVKLADFGIAKAQTKREQTAAGVIKGKVAFMSPEQATGAVIDRRSDLFSVGSMLYLMATDRPPFEAGTDLESLARVQRAEFAPPETVRPTLGPAITRIIARAMRLGPGERYQTADEMLADVERILRTEYHSAGQTELKQWLAQLARRDGHPPISKMAAAGGTASDGGGTDLNAGTSFELDDLELASISMTEVATTPPPMSLTPGTPSPGPRKTPPLTPGPTMVEGLGKSPPQAVGPAPTKHRRFGGFWMGVAVAFAAVIGLRYLGEWISHQHWFATPTTVGDSTVPTAPVPPVAAPAAVPAVNPDPAAATPAAPTRATTFDAAVAATPAKDHQPAVRADAGAAPVVAAAAEPAAAPDAGGAARPADDDDDDNSDEETLLRKADPRATESVIGEDEAAPARTPAGQKAAAKAAAKTTAAAAPKAAPVDKRSASVGAPADSSPARKPGAPPTPPTPAAPKTAPATGKAAPAASTTAAKTPAAAPYVTVSMHINSAPVGAVVRINKRVLGRTPINLRFKTGNDYQLTFVKNGYVTATKSVAVRGNRDGKFAVSLKKQPAASSRSFFRPHR